MERQTYAYKSSHGNSILTIFLGIIISLVFFLLDYYLTSSLIGSAAVSLVVFVIYFMLGVKVLKEWDRAPILTLGKYKGTYGPGLFFIIPIIQKMPYRFDLRTFSTTFSAEKTLTQDNVGVDVEAIMFAKIENPENTVLQVNDVYQSVSLAAQTALRDVIGKVSLSQMIVGRSEIADSVKTLIDQRVTPWGMNVISVEIRDVKIPDELQDAMAKVAIASRERDARVILAESEKLAATNMVAAAQTYQSNIYAMQLRALNMLYEIGISGKNHLIFIPTESRGLGIPTPIGVLGIEKMVGIGNEKDSGSENPHGGSSSGKGRSQTMRNFPPSINKNTPQEVNKPDKQDVGVASGGGIKLVPDQEEERGNDTFKI